MTTRGNVTSITRYSNAAAGTGAVTRNFTYDSLGNLLTAQLDCCNQESVHYVVGNQYSYPDTVTRGPAGGPQFATSATYNFDYGLVTSSTDENSQTTQYQYDNMMRLIGTTLPPQNGVAVQLNTVFDDAAQVPTVTNSTANSGNTGISVATLDGLGHVMQVDNKDGTTLISTVKNVYDQIWRRTQVSNPFTTGNPLYTTFIYDGLSRIKQVTPPSAGFTQYQYSGNSVLVTDPAGKQRKNFSDALGRLIEVDEPGWGDALTSHGSVIIDGFEGSTCLLVDGCDFPWQYVYDTGTVSITVNSSTKSASYFSSSTPSSIAVDLANAINADSAYPVTASITGATVYLTSRQGGTSANYSLSASSSTNDPGDFGSASFNGTRSGPNLTGGQDAVSPGTPSISRPLMTTYGYDALDHLLSVSQAAMQLLNGNPVSGQPRGYSYDSLGRLTSTTTPESGTVSTYYTTSGGANCAGDPSRPCRVQDARNIWKTFTYDGINRPSGVSYSDGTPSVTYTYDNGSFALDRLTKITEGANSQTFTYDNFGRITQVDNLIDTTHYLIGYAYNKLSQPTSITYPSGRVVAQSFDSVGRLCAIGAAGSTCTAGTSYLNGLSYNAAGEALGFTLGNNVQSQFTYNDHLQLASLRYFKSGSPDILNLGYDYTSTAVPGNNGQIQAVHFYTAPGTEDATKSEYFTYDAWSRLKAANTGTVSASVPGTWSLTWGYDRLGNRLTQAFVGGNLPGGIGQPNLSIDTATNRIQTSPYVFDNAGNMTHDATAAYSFDGANRMTSANSGAATYTYFGPLRIKKAVGGTTTTYVYSGVKPIAEYVGASLSKEYIYSGGRLLATIAGSTTTYHHPDHLSNRAETDATGNIVRSFNHFPYGETWYEPTGTDKDKFTSYERDSATGETGLDYAMFRGYSSGLARFMSADLLSGRLDAPQSLNRYGYTGNDPINWIDPLGLETVYFMLGNCVYSYESTSSVGSDGKTTVTAGPNHLENCSPGSTPGSTPGENPPGVGGATGSPHPPLQDSPSGPGGGNPKGKQKSAPRQKCEQDAQQKHANARAKVPVIALNGAAIAMWVGIGLAAGGGCAIGATGGGVVGGIILNAPGAGLGAVGGCIDGAALAVTAAAPEIILTMTLVGGITYVVERHDAELEFRDDLAVCAQIP